MWYRLKQFLAALTAHVSDADMALLDEWLTLSEQQLFKGMSVADQQHSLAVARIAARLAAGLPVNLAGLMQAALLHDVGKRRGELSAIGKAVMVLLRQGPPELAIRLESGRLKYPHFLRQWAAVYYDHPERGALLLSAAGTPADVVELVRRHHKAPAGDDPPELIILRRADDMN